MPSRDSGEWARGRAARLADVAGIRNPVGMTVGLYCPVDGERRARTEQVEIIGVMRNERVATPGAPHPPIVVCTASAGAAGGGEADCAE
jgi:hypothetical protein